MWSDGLGYGLAGRDSVGLHAVSCAALRGWSAGRSFSAFEGEGAGPGPNPVGGRGHVRDRPLPRPEQDRMQSESDGHVVGSMNADMGGCHHPVERSGAHPQVAPELPPRHAEHALLPSDHLLQGRRGQAGRWVQLGTSLRARGLTELEGSRADRPTRPSCSSAQRLPPSPPFCGRDRTSSSRRGERLARWGAPALVPRDPWPLSPVPESELALWNDPFQASRTPAARRWHARSPGVARAAPRAPSHPQGAPEPGRRTRWPSVGRPLSRGDPIPGAGGRGWATKGIGPYGRVIGGATRPEDLASRITLPPLQTHPRASLWQVSPDFPRESVPFSRE